MATEKDGFGLNKAGRLKAKRREQEAEAKKKALPLNPSFPYSMAPFPINVFGAISSAQLPKAR